MRLPPLWKLRRKADATPAQPADQLVELSKAYWGTWFLVLINAHAFVVQVVFTGGSGMWSSAQTLIECGGNYGPRTCLEGQFWRIFTCMFVHADIGHVLANMILLWALGRILEHFYGVLRFLTLYFVAGTAGSLASLWWSPTVVSVGASGAVFGVLGGVLAFLCLAPKEFPRATVARLAHILLLLAGYSIAAGFFRTGIGNAAHIAGLLTGFLFGFVLMPPRTATRWPVRELMSVIVAGAAFVVAFGEASARVRVAPAVVGKPKADILNSYRQQIQPVLDEYKRGIVTMLSSRIGAVPAEMPPEVERRLLRQAQQTFRATPIYGLPETCTNEDLLIAWPLLPLLEHPKDEEARAALRKLLEHARTTLTALKEIHPDDDDIADLHRGLLKYQEARIDMLVAGLKDDASVKNIMVIEFSTVAKRHGQFMEAVQEYLQRHRLRMR